jgi:hypothetical protein
VTGTDGSPTSATRRRATGCAGCGVTEAELDRERYGRAYVDGEGWNADEELY